MSKDWKNRLSVVYSTNPDFEYKTDEILEPETLDKSLQKLKVFTDKKARKGKTVTIISGFVGKTEDIKELEKILKTKCGVGGSSKDGDIIIQGDFKEKITLLLKELNYKVN